MIIGVSMVRNESDIIEAMIRQNLHYLDHLVIIDNASSDETPRIVERLVSEGLPCELRIDSSKNHLQHVVLTQFLNTCLDQYDADRVIILDADEIIVADVNSFISEMSDQNNAILTPWVTYVPTDADDPNAKTVLSRITHRRKYESPEYCKVSVPKRYLRTAALGPGSHGFKSKGRKIKAVKSVTAKLAHFPVRTSEQLLGKLLLGSWKVRTRKHTTSEAFHWIALAKPFVEKPYISSTQLADIAKSYVADHAVDLIKDPIKIHFDENFIQPVCIKNRLLEDVVHFTEELVKRIEPGRNFRQKIGDFIRKKVLRKKIPPERAEGGLPRG